MGAEAAGWTGAAGWTEAACGAGAAGGSAFWTGGWGGALGASASSASRASLIWEDTAASAVMEEMMGATGAVRAGSAWGAGAAWGGGFRLRGGGLLGRGSLCLGLCRRLGSGAAVFAEQVHHMGGFAAVVGCHNENSFTSEKSIP